MYVPICHFDSRSQQLIDCECLLVGEDTLNIQTEEDGFALIATVDECELGELQKVVHE